MAKPSLPSSVAGVEEGPLGGTQTLVEVDGLVLRELIPSADPFLVAASAMLAEVSRRTIVGTEVFLASLGADDRIFLNGPIDDAWSNPVGLRPLCVVTASTCPIRLTAQISGSRSQIAP